MYLCATDSKSDREVLYINRGARMAVLDNDDVIGLDVFLDEHGDECDASTAVVAVSDAYTVEGKISFFTIDLSLFEGQAAQ